MTTEAQGLRLVHAAGLDELYGNSGWSGQDRMACDRRLAEFIFRNLRGSGYEAAGYGSVEAVLAGDVAMIRRFGLMPDSDVHLYAALGPRGMQAFMLWYALGAGGPGLLPPDDQSRRALPPGTAHGDIAYGDWLIVDASSRVRGLGGVLFALMLRDMARGGYGWWYGRTVVPENLGVYEKLYSRKGRARLIGEWQDGGVRRVGFLGDLRGEWPESLFREALEKIPEWKISMTPK